MTSDKLKEIAKSELFDPKLPFVKMGNSKYAERTKKVYLMAIKRIFKIYSNILKEGEGYVDDFSFKSVWAGFQNSTYRISNEIYDKEWGETNKAIEKLRDICDGVINEIKDDEKRREVLGLRYRLEDLIKHKIEPPKRTKEGNVYYLMEKVLHTLIYSIDIDDFSELEKNMLSTGNVDRKSLENNILAATILADYVKHEEEIPQVSLALPVGKEEEIKSGDLWELDEIYDVEDEKIDDLYVPPELLEIETVDQALDYYKQKIKKILNN